VTARVSTSIPRQIFDPFKDTKDIGVASKIAFSRSNTEKVAALLVPHSALYTFREKKKLVRRWLSARSPILVESSNNLRSSLINYLSVCFQSHVWPKPSISGNSPVPAQQSDLFRRNVTLGAPTFRTLKNIMDETRALSFLAGKSHLCIAFDAKGIFGL
jgi:hypothetical protein